MKIGRVREDANDAFESLIGFEFILLDLKIKDKFMVLNPLTTEGF